MPRTPKRALASASDTDLTPAQPSSTNWRLELVLVTGMSGSGKSVALHALEDAGYYCIDNLPPELLGPLISLETQRQTTQLAVAIDIRSAQSLSTLPAHFQTLRERSDIALKTLFLDATDETLLRRFSETRRMHPLTNRQAQKRNPLHAPDPTPTTALAQAIACERDSLYPLRSLAHLIDTSHLHAQQLRGHVQLFVQAPPARLTLVFESFAFKRGIPLDADFVIDVRMLPNPHYEPALKPLTGKDAPVAKFLAAQEQVRAMQTHLTAFLEHWLPALAANQRSYVTVAIGCTGGQHRSVYLVEQLRAHFANLPSGPYHTQAVLARHRELD